MKRNEEELLQGCPRQPAAPLPSNENCRRIRRAAPSPPRGVRRVQARAVPPRLPWVADQPILPAAFRNLTSEPQNREPKSGLPLALEGNGWRQLQTIRGDRTIHGRQPNHRRPIAVLDAAVVVIVERLARVGANTRVARNRRVTSRFQNEARLEFRRHAQRYRSVHRVRHESAIAPVRTLQRDADRPVLGMQFQFPALARNRDWPIL